LSFDAFALLIHKNWKKISPSSESNISMVMTGKIFFIAVKVVQEQPVI
jgi:hypothetical protein